MTNLPPEPTRTPGEEPSDLDAGLAVAFAPESAESHHPSPTHDGEVGAVIAGKYKLLERIGEGGMGSVWMAQQTEPVKRLVAIKLIKTGMDSRAVLARFDAERQALALMDHPNIAKILDGGVTDKGSPFFVMELVKGIPITQFCDARKLTPQQRLELFVPVCQAIQHAHHKGIIHRDIKPSNVIVALYDDQAVPKVIDFGVAKATGQALTEHTLNTGFGGVVGTPQYMSPEQATLNNLDIDTRSDVYSLGVLLYELLAGSPPFNKQELEKAGLLEILRVIREDEPPRPSTRLSTADALPSLSANRGTEPKKLTGLLRNELDWIVMKALEKDRSRRYETANGFAADILRYLSGEPVNAHPPSATYRMKKFLRKHKGPVLAASLVAFALVVGIIGTSAGLVWADWERRAAVKARASEAEQRELAEKKEREAESEKVKALEAAKAERIAKESEAEQRKAAEDANRRAFQALRSFTDELMEKQFATKTELSENEKSILRNALKQWEVFAQSKGETAEARDIWVEGAYRVATLQYKLGLNAEAEVNYRVAVILLEKLATDFPAAPEYRANLAASHNNLGALAARHGKPAESEELHRKALAIREKLTADFPAAPRFRFDLAASHINLGLILASQGRHALAEEQVRKGLAILENLVADFPAVPQYHSELADSYNSLATLLHGFGKRAEEEGQFRNALAIQEKLTADFPTVAEYRHKLADSQHNLGVVLSDFGKPVEAEEQYRKAMANLEKLAADFPAVPQYRASLANSHKNLGRVLKARGQRAEAEEYYRKALANLEKLAADFPAVPEYRSSLANSHNSLGVHLNDLGNPAEAEDYHRKALAILEKLVADFPAVPEYRSDLANSLNNLGRTQRAQGQRAEAEDYHRKALAIFEKLAADFPAVPEYRSDLAKSHNSLGLHLKDLGKPTEAEDHHRKALAIQEKLVADFPSMPLFYVELAVSHYNQGLLLAALAKPAEAEEQFRKALAIQEKLVADYPALPEYRTYLASSHVNLGVLLAGLRQLAEAEEQFRKALAIQEKLTANFPTVPEYRSGLASSHNRLGVVLGYLGKRLEAEDHHRKALAIQEKLVADFPSMPPYLVDLADSRNNLGLLLGDLGKPAEAEEQFRMAVATQEKVVADYPAVPQYHINLGGSYCNLGSLLRDSGKLADSLEWYAKAIRTLTTVYQKDTRLVTARQFLRNSHLGRAQSYDRLEKYAEAVKDWDRAVELSPKEQQPAVRAMRANSRFRAGQVAEAVAEVAELTKSDTWKAGQWYDFACIYAVASGKDADKKEEYAQRAVELLQKAVKAGWKDAAHIAKDTDLDALRDRDDFKKLLSELEKK